MKQTQTNWTATDKDKFKKFNELIKDINIAMFTTVDEDGVLRSRPMATQQAEFDGDLWFFTRADTGKVEQVERYDQVNVAYASPKNDRYVSVVGSAEVLNNRAKIKELWNPILKTWFPDGVEDPELRLIKVNVREAEYWDTPGGLVSVAIGFVKSVVTGKEAEMGDNEKVSFASR